jgi:DNA polymerase-3 subunit epsilon
MTWFDPAQRWLCWDLETTAPDPAEARLVTACVAFVGGGKPTEVMSWVVDAGVDVPAEAAEVHGYTTERVRAEGKPIADVLPEIVGYLAGAVAAGVPLVAFNACYDNTVLACETVRLGLDPFGDVLADAVVLDPFVIDKRIDRYRPGKRTLETACQVYRVKLDGAHDSEFDALAAGRVLYRIGQRCQMTPGQIRAEYAERRYPNNFVKAFAELGAMSLRELHDAQREWYQEQSEGLAAHWRKVVMEKRHEADGAADRDEFDLATTLRAEADELLERADGVNTSWPLQVVSP